MFTRGLYVTSKSYTLCAYKSNDHEEQNISFKPLEVSISLIHLKDLLQWTASS